MRLTILLQELSFQVFIEMFDEISIILQVILIYVFIAIASSFFGLRHDIENYNKKLMGKEPDNETSVFTLRYNY